MMKLGGARIFSRWKITRLNRIAVIMTLGFSIVAADTIYGQTFPMKSIRIVTTTPGSGADVVSRLIAQAIAGPLGQQVIVDNRAGLVAIETVVGATPDGYILLCYGSPIWLAQFMRDHVDWDPIKDLSPISIPETTPNIVVVYPSVPAKDIRELITLAKAQPGKLNYGSGAAGTSAHLAAELFKSMAGVSITRVGYKGVAPALNDIIGGQIQVMFPVIAAAAPHIKSGRLRGLAVTSAKPSELEPDLPTVSASGLPGYESVSIVGIFAPARTSVAIVNQLNQEIVKFLHSPDAKKRLLSSGVEAVGSSPGELTAMMKSEMIRMGKVIKEAGIRDE